MWADEEEPQWGADTEEEVKTEAAPAEGAPAEGGEAAPAAGGEAAAPAEAEAEGPKKPGSDMARPLYYRHWVRPKFLQYNYIYDYRKNYYDDVIDYLDRRTHGINRELPKPQVWGERVLRTYNNKTSATASAIKRGTDVDLIHNLHHIRAIHHMHSKDYYSRKFTLSI